MKDAEASRSGQDSQVVPFPATPASPAAPVGPAAPVRTQVTFDRTELQTILSLYGRMVASGEWRDYAIDFGRDRAVFSIFRHASEMPLYRICKEPALARRQGAYSVVAANGRILKRGPLLDRVLQVLEKPIRLVT